MSVSIVNITTSKQAEKLAEIGAQFKRVREDKELSIPHLTATTLISERYLRAIEDGEIESLPEPVYVRGFIRKYGTALGVGDLSEDFPLNPVLPEQKWIGSPAAELRPLHLYALYVGVIAGAVSLLATFLNAPDATKINDSQTNFGDAAQIKSAKSNKASELTDLLLPKIGGLGALKQSVVDPLAMAAVPNISGNNLPTTPQNKSITPDTLGVKPQSETNGANSSFNSTFNALAIGAAFQSDGVANSSAIATNGDFNFVGNKPVNVGVVMTGQSWLRITVDGQTEFEGVLDEGKKLAWSGDRQVSIRVGNASSVALSYNNQPIKVLGREGEVTERTFSANQPSNVDINGAGLRGLIGISASRNNQ